MKHPSKLAGWCEEASFPDLGIDHIAVKLDTGARTSALHVINLETFPKDGKTWLKFGITPLQGSDEVVVWCESPILRTRTIKSSNGQQETRYTIKTRLTMGGMTWPIEVSLTNRDEMGFRMLLGRRAMRNRLIVDPHRTYILGSNSSLTPSSPEARHP